MSGPVPSGPTCFSVTWGLQAVSCALYRAGDRLGMSLNWAGPHGHCVLAAWLQDDGYLSAAPRGQDCRACWPGAAGVNRETLDLFETGWWTLNGIEHADDSSDRARRPREAFQQAEGMTESWTQKRESLGQTQMLRRAVWRQPHLEFWFGDSDGKESSCNVGDLGSIPGLGRSPGRGQGTPLQYSGLENSKDYSMGLQRVRHD